MAAAFLANAQTAPPNLIARAEALARSGDKQGALEQLGKAAEAKPQSADSEDKIGFLYAVLGQSAEAAQHFQNAISLNAKYAPAHFHLGVAEWLANNRQNGLAELKKAAELDSKSAEYQYRLGSAYMDLGDLGAAVEAYGHAVELKPADDGMRDTYSWLLVETRQPEKAISEAQKVLAHNPADTAAEMNIGYAHLKTGDFVLAEQAYRTVIKQDPNLAAGHYDLAIALKMQDKLDAAKQELQEAIRLDPELAEAHYTLGILAWQLGDFAETAQQMRAAIGIRPEYAEAHYMLGIMLKQSGDLDSAIAELKEAIRLDPTTPGPFNTLGQILRQKGDLEGSKEAFATGARLSAEKNAQLANSLEQGMRGGMAPKPLPGRTTHE